MKYRKGHCFKCNHEAIIVKRLPSGNLCKKHNDQRLKGKKNPKDEPGELALFISIWQTRPHVSFVSGLALTNFDIRCFFHILPKGSYRRYKLNENNIILTTPEEHHKWHNDRGSLRNIPEWEKVFNLYDELRETYIRESGIHGAHKWDSLEG